jgi:hypothetical protein
VASPGDSAHSPPVAAVALRLYIEPGEGVAGTLEVDGENTFEVFSGWVELMAAITQARRPRPAKESPASGDANPAGSDHNPRP